MSLIEKSTPRPPHPVARGATVTMAGGFAVLTIEMAGKRLVCCLTAGALAALRDSTAKVAADAVLLELVRERSDR